MTQQEKDLMLLDMYGENPFVSAARAEAEAQDARFPYPATSEEVELFDALKA